MRTDSACIRNQYDLKDSDECFLKSMPLTLCVHSGCRYGQSVLLDFGRVGLGVANKEREGKRCRERGRGDAKQAPDRVSVGVSV